MVHYSTDFPNNTQRTIDELFSKATIPFSQTLYVGESDFVEGGTDVTMDSVDLGALDWNVDTTTRPADGATIHAFYAGLSPMKVVNSGAIANLKCSQYVADAVSNVDYGGGNTVKDGIIGGADANNRVWVYDSRYNDYSATEFKNAMSGVQLVYEKATPTTITTPKTDLKLLQGTNNLTTNGTTITLDYIPNNSIGDAVKASEEYTDRAVERVIPKAKLACFYEIFDESGTLYDATIPEDCNFFLVEYRIQNRIGSTLIKAKSIDFYIPVVVNVGGEQHWVEFLYNSIYHTIDYTSNVTTGFGVLSIYTI